MGEFVIENGILQQYTGTDTDVIIPEGVREIGRSAFEKNKNVTSVTIPQSVTTIGEGAFSWCEKLQSITLPESVTTIGLSAFSLCTNLQSITLPAGLTAIGYRVFSSCHNLQSITLPEGVATIGYNAFSGCTNLQSITLPAGLTTIGSAAFSLCTNLQSITIPEGVTTIGNRAFSGCRNLQSITLPAGLTTIGESTFSWCEKLQRVAILGDGSQSLLTRLAKKFLKELFAPRIPAETLKTEGLMLPAAIGFLKDRASYQNAESIARYEKYLASQRKKILPYFFREDHLAAIAYYAEKGKITPQNFEKDYLAPAQQANATECVAWLLNWKNEHITPEMQEKQWEREMNKDPLNAADMKKLWCYRILADGTLSIYGYKGTDTDIFIPERIGNRMVTAIEAAAFSFQNGFLGMYIPDCVTTVEPKAFVCCRKILVSEGNPFYTSDEDGVLFSKDKSALVAAPGGLSGVYEIPQSVLTVAHGAFSRCEDLTGIRVAEGNLAYSSDEKGVLFDQEQTVLICAPCGISGVYEIPEGVMTVREMAFCECEDLTELTVPEGVSAIDSQTFYGCKNLSRLTLPASVTEICFQAFYGCENLTIHAPKGSYAESYAKENNIPFAAD